MDVKLTALAAGVLMVAAPAFADEVAQADVVFGEYGEVEASLTGVPGDAAAGREVFINRRLGNCLACHENSDMADQPFHGEVGPVLDGVGDRWSEADLRGIIVNSKNVFPDTIMPAFYVSEGFINVREDLAGQSILTAQQVEDVVAYLMTLQE
ncbi:sulfur oxidation c-type cytochrome SoxX [Nioella ostreopsis]|jgi:sulfur-oxidizing protein SoxX|uniref:sulfur oxidation c-type cytochrome SoxX n=1 Tax=Nioella ostreopsis TaxID=2448479 RepID=UPI000FDB68DE|nr:sulfur oxidation c-type cytochrome SoxX [Nioella ostreopsis]